jgi:hypothetical protein
VAAFNRQVTTFSLTEILNRIQNIEFRWDEIQYISPFGFLEVKEVEYALLVDVALDSLSNDGRRSILLDILDVQWCAYVEQLLS